MSERFLPLAYADKCRGIRPKLGIYAHITMPDDDPVRIWGGVGDCDPGTNGVDPAGAIYTGLGELLNVPAFQALINGKAERIALNMSGVTEEMVWLFDEQAMNLRDAPVRIGIGAFDEDWQPMDPVNWCWMGFADVSTMSRKRTETGFQRTLIQNIGSIFTGRSRGQHSYFTDASQQALHPGDKFCERTPLYNRGYLKRWPRT